VTLLRRANLGFDYVCSNYIAIASCQESPEGFLLFKIQIAEHSRGLLLTYCNPWSRFTALSLQSDNFKQHILLARSLAV
jgi:hypothetical protein